ncbi:esterase FE4-like [Schistocerca piceifrons]|uniref:esterase FE4-like n=1 Tax=Schistocerca piceifrons TaxID=274613 RepID=UPI001F5E7902|nr:esterase FE4-like [Schistocerca piceifrons]
MFELAEFTEGVISTKIHDSCVEKQFLTVAAMLKKLKIEAEDFPDMSETTFWCAIRKLGFRYKKFRKKPVLMENNQVVRKRRKSVFGQRPMVQISDGKIRGIYDFAYYGRQFAGFIGIPYAEPPLGQLRFKEPVPVKPWQGIWDASRLKINCLQLDDDRQKVVGEEDCLYLNVFTSQLPSVNSIHPKLDVVIFFHPGAFMFGGGDWYGPHYIMDRSVVLVTVNYRLNVLGFLSTLDEVLPGNNGLKDQVLALKWVKKNIAAFGGNPDSVTIAGTSAGASSVQYHFLSPLSKGLFVRGISTSGTTLCAWANAEGMREKAFRLGAAVGCDTDSSTMLIRCLRNRPAGQLVEKVLLFQVQ